MAEAEVSRPKNSPSHANTWLCSQSGILPSQYTPRAVDKLIADITSNLEAIEASSLCSQGVDAHSAFLQELCTICLPIILNPKLLPIVEKLISGQLQCSNLSDDFLNEVTALQKGESGYLDPPKLDLSYEARVNLWAVYLPSFREELIDLVKALRPVELSRSEMERIISARNVPRACLEHFHLMLYTEEVLKVLYISANASTRIRQVVDCFNHQLLEAHREYPTSSSRQYPQFNTDKWTVPQTEVQQKNLDSEH